MMVMEDEEPWTQIQIAAFRGETQKVKQLAEQMSNPDPFFFEDPNAANPQGNFSNINLKISNLVSIENQFWRYLHKVWKLRKFSLITLFTLTKIS